MGTGISIYLLLSEDGDETKTWYPLDLDKEMRWIFSLEMYMK